LSISVKYNDYFWNGSPRRWKILVLLILQRDGLCFKQYQMG
jgi:hypothetical protein